MKTEQSSQIMVALKNPEAAQKHVLKMFLNIFSFCQGQKCCVWNIINGLESFLQLLTLFVKKVPLRHWLEIKFQIYRSLKCKQALTPILR